MEEETKVKLRCGVYDEGSVFSVEIKRDADVEALQKTIFDDQRYHERFSFPASALTLYLARKEGETTWLADDDNLDALLQGDVDKQYMKMRSSWILDEDCFGKTFQPGRKKIHVLVELPDLPNKRSRVETVPRIEQCENVPQINIAGVQYVTMPAAFLEKCGYKVPSDVMLYCRSQVRDLWSFVQDEVVAKNGRGFIVGPPGTGKSVSTLSFVAYLDRQEWNVVWIHLSNRLDTCLSLGTKEYWQIDDLSSFDLPRVTGKKLFICLDGFKATNAHELFFKRVLAHLDKTNERLIVCSSMATLGKRNWEDDHWVNIQVFFMYSWTQDEYIAAIADQAFYDKIVPNLDATSSNEVNKDDGFEAEWSEEDKKKHALDLKFYYAGGSCRFMFQYLTDKVIEILEDGVESAANKSDLVKYCGGQFHSEAINKLYGMHRDGLHNARFPVSSYAASLFAKECDEETIAQVLMRQTILQWMATFLNGSFWHLCQSVR